MTIDKTLISHVIAELIVISGLSFYYHKKCGNLQLQINELNSKLEKMNGINYLNSIKRHEQFESQTVQHINKIYSILNNSNNVNMNILPNIDSFKVNNDNGVKENFYSPSMTNVNNYNNNNNNPVAKPQTNSLMSTLSMLGPLTTMFKVVMEPKPPHPNDIFDNIDIKSQLNNRKIVEVEDDDTEVLDDELKDELNDLRSNVTTAMNTPVFTPKLSITSSIPSLELCENGICKLNLDNNENMENMETNDNMNTSNNLTNEIMKENIVVKENREIDKSSPLRYISPVETKRGRPKKIQ